MLNFIILQNTAPHTEMHQVRQVERLIEVSQEFIRLPRIINNSWPNLNKNQIFYNFLLHFLPIVNFSYEEEKHSKQ